MCAYTYISVQTHSGTIYFANVLYARYGYDGWGMRDGRGSLTSDLVPAKMGQMPKSICMCKLAVACGSYAMS